MRNYFALSLFLLSNLHGSCVQDGMNLWRLTENVSCSVGAVCEIKQPDITPGTYAMNTSGHYKLCENVVGPARIDINASNVIFDLGGYYADGIVINVNSNAANVTIRNGTIRNTVYVVDININTRNVLIEDLVIDTIIPNPVLPVLNYAFRIASGPVTGVTLRNVSIYNGCPQNILFSGDAPDYVTDIILENVSCIGTNSAYTTELQANVGIIYMSECENVVLKNVSIIDQLNEIDGIIFEGSTNVNAQDVSITSELSTPVGLPTAYKIIDSPRGLHKNIQAHSGPNRVYNRGFRVQGFSSGTILESCSAILSAGDGFSVNTFECTFQNCIAIDNGDNGFVLGGGGRNKYYNCIAQLNATHGFNTFTPDENLCHGCVASSNAVNGFNCNAVGGTTQLTLEYCLAENNVNNGFDVNNLSAVLSYCNSFFNGNIGFFILGLAGASHVLQECVAARNASSGIFVTAGSPNVFLIDTRSTYNVTGLNGALDVTVGATIVTF